MVRGVTVLVTLRDMAFGRLLAVSPRLLVRPATTPLIGYRFLSASARICHAEGLHSTTTEPGRSGSTSTPPGLSSANYESLEDINPYKGGPRVIDKAVHLFFFTEILRGTCFLACILLASLHMLSKGCGL